MDFEQAKNLLKEAIDEAETQGDILRIWIEKVYQQGKDDAIIYDGTVQIIDET